MLPSRPLVDFNVAMLGSKTSQQFQSELEAYLNKLAKIPKVRSGIEFMTFLEVREHILAFQTGNAGGKFVILV